jgi:predicted GNAT superfamily acetyltransferase|tara:strand:- start:4511 stop:5014 length:504 start_codon:yes stop_codon:yes gene_type:complete
VKKESKYIIQEFSSSIEQNLLEQIYSLNQENTPEVGDLSSIKELQNLLRQSSNNYYVIFKNRIIGFMICFREKSDYNSKNYKFFKKKESKFLYVDRIAINDKYRRFGIGKNLYLKIESIAANNDLPICCEVNTDPLNEISIRFHNDLGFTEVGICKFDNHSVVYLRK